MLKLNDKQYKLVLVDTNVLSEICKTAGFYSSFLQHFPLDEYILSYSPFTLFELSKNEEVFQKYKDQFFILPSMIIKPYEVLINEEKDVYSRKEKIEVSLLSPLQIQIDGEKFNQSSLHELFKYDSIKERFEYWDSNITNILNGILDLRTNFPPDSEGRYSKKRVIEFVKNTVEQQVYTRFPDFSKKQLSSDHLIDYSRFPSLKIMAYVTFYKFYSDTRKPIKSDVMDLIISSSIPYVEAFVSEGNMVNIMSKINNNDNFIDHIKMVSIKELEKTARNN